MYVNFYFVVGFLWVWWYLGRVSSGEADIETDHNDTDSELSEHRTHIPTQVCISIDLVDLLNQCIL